MTSTRIHAAILALRNVVQAYMAERDLASLPTSPLVLSDLRYDERAIGANPLACFAFYLAPTCTYLVPVNRWAHWGGRPLATAYAAVLQEIATTLNVVDPFDADDCGELYFWDGAKLHRCPTVVALATRFGDELERVASEGRSTPAACSVVS